MVHKDRIIATLAYIAKYPERYSQQLWMGQQPKIHGCGTVSCIAGTAVLLHGDHDIYWWLGNAQPGYGTWQDWSIVCDQSVPRLAAELLGLDYDPTFDDDDDDGLPAGNRIFCADTTLPRIYEILADELGITMEVLHKEVSKAVEELNEFAYA